MKVTSHWLAPLIFALSLTETGCKDVSFTSVKYVPKPPPVQLPPIPVMLNVVRLNFESWSKSCLYVIVNGNESQAVSVGCNKGSEHSLPAKELPVIPGACNKLSFSMAVYRFTKPCGADNCADPSNFAANPNMVRTTQNSGDLTTFFKIQDARTLSVVDPTVALTPAQIQEGVQTEAQAKGYVRTDMHRWLRVYFEDQSNENMRLFQNQRTLAQPQIAVPNPQATSVGVVPSPVPSSAPGSVTASLPGSLPSPVPSQSPPAKVQLQLQQVPQVVDSQQKSNHGIDFNDFIFDIKTENVKIAIDGTPFTCD